MKAGQKQHPDFSFLRRDRHLTVVLILGEDQAAAVRRGGEGHADAEDAGLSKGQWDQRNERRRVIARPVSRNVKPKKTVGIGVKFRVKSFYVLLVTAEFGTCAAVALLRAHR